jgi:hypothetical protein
MVIEMEYGVAKDICVGTFREDGRWVDFCAPWSSVCPRLQFFQYADDGKDAAMLLNDFHVRVGNLVRSALAGWDYDGGSIPRIFWTTIGHPYMVSHLIQFSVHDMDYCANLVPRSRADSDMLNGLAAFGGNCWYKRNKVWLAVRAGGSCVYHKTSKELMTYRNNYIFLTNLSVTGGYAVDRRLTGVGPRESARPEIAL